MIIHGSVHVSMSRTFAGNLSSYNLSIILDEALGSGRNQESGKGVEGFFFCNWGLTPQQEPGSYQGGEMMMRG